MTDHPHRRAGDSDVARSILRWLKVLVVLTVVLYLAVAGLAAFDFVNSSDKRHEIAANQMRIVSALCAVRKDLGERIANGDAFLKTHPQGLPSLGITAAAIRIQIAMQRSTLQALAPVICPKPARHPTSTR
jgi:hypothetical protein